MWPCRQRERPEVAVSPESRTVSFSFRDEDADPVDIADWRFFVPGNVHVEFPEKNTIVLRLRGGQKEEKNMNKLGELKKFLGKDDEFDVCGQYVINDPSPIGDFRVLVSKSSMGNLQIEFNPIDVPSVSEHGLRNLSELCLLLAGAQERNKK